MSLDPDYENAKMEIRRMMRELPYIQQIADLLDASGYMGNGWDVRDDVFACSDSTCLFYMYDDETRDFEKAWYYPEEWKRNPLTLLIAQGYVDFEPIPQED
jgi:hypothetical protein